MRASTHDSVSVQPASWSGFGGDLGIPRKLVQLLELHARLLHPESPDDALGSREAFEQLAEAAVLEAPDRLRTRYATVSALADASRSLGFDTESEAPALLRRASLDLAQGKSCKGVIARMSDGEITILCPLTGAAPGPLGSTIHMNCADHGGGRPTPLRLVDVVDLPGLRAIHLSPLPGDASFGREDVRHTVAIDCFLIGPGEDSEDATPTAGKILDLSIRGARVACDSRLEPGSSVRLQAFLNVSDADPFTAECRVSWSEDGAPQSSAGLRFEDLDQPDAERLDALLAGLREAQP